MPFLAILAGAGFLAAAWLGYRKLATAESDRALEQANLRGDRSYNRMPPGGIGPL